MKFLKSYIFLVLLISGSALEAKVVMSQEKTGYCGSNWETWYLGSNEQAIKFNKYGSGGSVDDGLFVAIKDGGPHGGYSYYDLLHPAYGEIDGGPAHLPPTPGKLPVSGHFPVARKGNCVDNSGPYIAPEAGSLVVSGRGKLKAFPDGGIIPIGSKFFFWVSGGGAFSLSTAIVEKINSHLVTVKTQSIPKPEYELWFAPSDVLERTFTVIDN